MVGGLAHPEPQIAGGGPVATVHGVHGVQGVHSKMLDVGHTLVPNLKTHVRGTQVRATFARHYGHYGQHGQT